MGRFARYEMLDRIALGGMAEVWAARGFRSDGSVHELVVKRILPQLALDPDFEAMLMEEARMTALLRHPKIVQTLDWGRLDDTCFIAMERVVGLDGRRLLDASARKGMRVPPSIALFAVAEVLDALEHAHGRRDEVGDSLGIVHRDVSPANVLLSTQGQVKLTDFGIARAKFRASHTQVGQVRGKPRYMSPEQAQGKELDARSDVFATGLVLYELLTGKPAFVGGETIEEVIAGLERDVPRPSSLVPDLPAGIDEVVLAMCERDPGARYPTAADARLAIEEVAFQRNLLLHPGPLAELVQSFVKGGAAPNVTRVLRVKDLKDSAWLLAEDIAELAAPSEEDDRTRVRRDPGPEAAPSLPGPSTPPVTESYFNALLSPGDTSATNTVRSPVATGNAPETEPDDTVRAPIRRVKTTLPAPPWIALPVILAVTAIVALVLGGRVSGGTAVSPSPGASAAP